MLFLLRKQAALTFLILLTVLVARPALAQVPAPTAPAESPAEAQESLYDPLNRTTPEGTALGFLEAMTEGDLTRAVRYFDLRDIPRSRRQATGRNLALQLQQLLDRGGQIAPRWQLSRDPAGQLGDELPPQLDRVGALPSPQGNQPILVERIDDNESGMIWLFSKDTVELIPELAEQLEASLLERWLPERLNEHLWRGVPVGHWLAVLVLGVLAVFASWLLTRVIGWVAPRVSHGSVRPWVHKVAVAALPPLMMFLAVVFFYVSSTLIGVSILARQFFAGTSDVIVVLAIAWFFWRMSDLVGETSIQRMNKRGRPGAVAAIGLFRRFAKTAVVALAFMAILNLLGFDVTAGLAALGIGGLAIALGAQKTVENFVGSLTLIADQPIRVGDFCRFGETLGTVEDIGMRSTRIRTLDRTVITIPNGEFSSLRIENYARRDMFWFHPILALRYETTPDQMRYLLVELRALLYAHPKVSPDPARVRFVGLAADSLSVEIFAYVLCKDISEYLDIQEDLLLRIMDIVQRSGTGFAFPSQTLYFAKDSGLDRERTQQAEATVNRWREAGDLQLPQFDEARIAELRNSIPYPPPGAAMAEPKEPV